MCKSQAKCRMGVALPTAHPQHPPRYAGLNVRRAEGICVNGLLCFIPAVEQSCWTQDSQSCRAFLLIEAPPLGFEGFLPVSP